MSMNYRDIKDPFLRGYIEAALFTTDAHAPRGDYLESGRCHELVPRLPDSFLEQAKADCAEFEAANAELLEQAGDYEQNGRDFWFTRNRHGVGFWDRGYPDEVADPLTEACRKFGEEYSLVVSDLCDCEECQPEL